MEKVISNEVVEQVLSVRLPITNEVQKCSFILPDGRFIKLTDHYEAFKFLVVEQLVQCIPDAEQLLNDLGYVRYSYIGYVTLPEKPLTHKQYNSLEEALIYISKYRDTISIQLHSDPRFYSNFELNDIPHIIKRIKQYYNTEFSLRF